MHTFTYYQYIQCIHKLRLNAVLYFAEESMEYKRDKEKNNKAHDKLIKNTLKNKHEMVQFINQFLNPKQKIKENNITLYTNSYITKKYKSKEADLVYKLNDKEIYFLVEHQSTIDNNMPFRMLNYSIDIMQEWSRNKKIKQRTSYPIVVPILIYTGNQKWKVETNFKEKQINNNIFENYKIDFKYNLVDINKLPYKLLLEKNTMFAYNMIIEKTKNKKELEENLKMIIKTVKDKDKLQEIYNIIIYLLNGAIDIATKEELLEKIEMKVGETKMSSFFDRLVEENIKLIRKGKKEGKIEGIIQTKMEIAKNMIKKEQEDKVIIETTGITKEELEKIKKELVIN